MVSDRLKSAIAAATIYNQELDRRLSDTGIVDVALFREFAYVQDDPNASSVGWLELKLRVLSARVSSGASLSLHEPSCGTLVVITTLEQFVAWADRHFPVAKVRP
jgi:hypothetical protein